METIERTRGGRVADQEAFFRKADAAFSSPEGKDRRGEMLRLLLSCNLFLPFLRARSEWSGEQIAEALRLAMPLLPSVDLKLARYVCDERYSLEHETLLKFLDALLRVSHPGRISGTLLPLLSDRDPRVRSKAARLMNIGEDDRAWRDAEADPRVLANLIEALWDIDTPHRRTRFWKAVHSPSPRVAGNALVGLYRIGDQQARALIVQMADHAAVEFRRTAVWAMGETGDAEFLGCLSSLLGRESGSVRMNVLRSMSRIRKRLSAAASAEEASRTAELAAPARAESDPGESPPPGYVT